MAFPSWLFVVWPAPLASRDKLAAAAATAKGS